MFIDFRERGRGRERKTDNAWLPPAHTLTRDRNWSLGLCPDWELNPQPYGTWDQAQLTVPPDWGSIFNLQYNTQKRTAWKFTAWWFSECKILHNHETGLKKYSVARTSKNPHEFPHWKIPLSWFLWYLLPFLSLYFSIYASIPKCISVVLPVLRNFYSWNNTVFACFWHILLNNMWNSCM